MIENEIDTGTWYSGSKQMKTYIALFRGINVGGNSILPMKELVAEQSGADHGSPLTRTIAGCIVAL
jgi:hypothetical protein